MSRIPYILALLTLLFCLTTQSGNAAPCSEMKVPAKEPADIDCIKGLEWTNSETYKKDFAKAVADAKAFCTKYQDEHKNLDLAIVSDIDETLLDNREEIREHCRDWDFFFKWIQLAKAPLLPDTAELLDWARKRGFAIFLLSGRTENERKSTIVNLVRNNVAYDGLYVRANNDHSAAEQFKTAVRKKIEALGFTIVVNIGDQFSDLQGGYALDCEKLPNKMYFIK